MVQLKKIQPIMVYYEILNQLINDHERMQYIITGQQINLIANFLHIPSKLFHIHTYQSSLTSHLIYQMTTLYTEPHLPQKYAQNLLDCEIQFQLNEKIPSEMLMRLIQLYRIGIEYYESIRSYKYLYFQRRMNAIVKSERILSSLNDKKTQVIPQKKPQIIVIDSLTDFKKEQISLSNGNPICTQTLPNTNKTTHFQSLNTPTLPQQSPTKKKLHPFKRHLQQKFQQKITQPTPSPQTVKNLEREQQLKRLLQLQHREKQQQLTQTMNNIESDKQIRKFIDVENKKLSKIESKVDEVVKSQEEEFRKKLEQRRERVKSNTDKRRLTKSFSQNYNIQIHEKYSTALLQHMNEIQNCELKIHLNSGKKQNPSSNKIFSSVAQNHVDDFNYDDYTYEEVTQPGNNDQITINKT